MEKRSLRNGSFPQSPIARSPMPKSPAPYEKYKSRCAYGLISFFRFRHRCSKKMISNQKGSSRHGKSKDSGNHYKRKRLEKWMCSDDGVKQRTLMVDSGDVEMNQSIGDDVSAEQQIKRTSRRRFPMYECYDISTAGHERPAQQNALNGCSDKDSTAKPVQFSGQEIERDCNSRSISTARHEKTNEAFITQKLIAGEYNGDGLRNQSKNFFEALEILNSNKDLFLKLLKDPNSLTVKHIEELRDSQTTDQDAKPGAEAELSENQVSCADSDALEDLVILKPGSMILQNSVEKISQNHSCAHHSLRILQQSVKPTVFQFEQMTRKLIRAMGIGRKHRLLLHDGAEHERGSANGFKGSCAQKSTRKAGSDVDGTTAYSLDVKTTERISKIDNSEAGGVKSSSTCAHDEKHDQQQDQENLRNTLRDNFRGSEIPESVGSFNNEMILKGKSIEEQPCPVYVLDQFSPEVMKYSADQYLDQSFCDEAQQHKRRKNLIIQVMKHINWKLLLGLTHETVDQIMENDLNKSGAWMDIRLQTEDIVNEMVESIVEELVIDTAVA